MSKKNGDVKGAMTEAKQHIPIARYIPYSVHVAPDVLKLRENGDFCATWRLHGIPFETAAVEDIAVAKRQLVNFLHSIRGTSQAEPTALWVHRVRRRSSDRLVGQFPSRFAAELDKKYWKRFEGDALLRNELYLTVVVRPGEALSLMQRRARTRSAEALLQFDAEALERFEVLCQQVDASVGKYGGERLTCFERTTPRGETITYSPMLSFYRWLVTGVYEPVPVQPGPVYQYLCDVRFFAGDHNGIVQINHPKKKTFIGYLDLLDYPELSEPGMNNTLFFGDYEFAETQSFSFLSKRDGIAALEQQRKRLISGGEGSEKQVQGMLEAIEDVSNGTLFMGEYHYTLGLFGDSVADTQRVMALARTTLQEDSGYTVATVDVIPECAHLAQLPGNWRYRPREAKISTRNFACMAPMHNFDMGKRDGNPWGQAITLLETPARQPHYLNLHDSPIGRNSLGEKLPGNVYMCGMTGTGKSVLLGLMLLQATKVPKLRILFLDKDRGAEALIRQMGGRYRQLRRGLPTGFNPFQWQPTPKNIAFTEQLVYQCAKRGDDEVLDVRLENVLLDSVRKVFALPRREDRRISALMQFVGETTELGQRLAKWCRTSSKTGSNAWVLDNAKDTTNFEGGSVFGFDYTEFIDDKEVGPIILAYILEAADTLLNGDPFIYVMEEFAKAVNSRAHALIEFARDKQTTIRKLFGLGIFVTQSPSQVKDSPIGASLREQCATQIFLPNPAADAADYVDGFKLTVTEFETIKSFARDSRMFLVKQGQRSAVCRLDLSDMRDELEIISGTLDNVLLLDQLREELGTDEPDVWREPFLKRVRARREAPRAMSLAEPATLT